MFELTSDNLGNKKKFVESTKYNYIYIELESNGYLRIEKVKFKKCTITKSDVEQNYTAKNYIDYCFKGPLKFEAQVINIEATVIGGFTIKTQIDGDVF